jgi:hypothetical protein
MDEKNSILQTLGVTPEQIIGYAYAGLLAAACLAIVDSQSIKSFIDSLGALLSTLIFLGLGIGIYTFYFLVLGEFILYPFQHFFHTLMDKIRNKTGAQHTSTIAFIGYFGVPVGYRRAAYEAIKSNFYDVEERRRIQLAHGELHVLYLTAVELSITAMYLKFILGNSNVQFIIMAVIAYLGAFIGDTRQHSLEAYKLRAYGQEKVKAFLSEIGYISSNN